MAIEVHVTGYDLTKKGLKRIEGGIREVACPGYRVRPDEKGIETKKGCTVPGGIPDVTEDDLTKKGLKLGRLRLAAGDLTKKGLKPVFVFRINAKHALLQRTT